MKILVCGHSKQLTDHEILALGVGATPEVAATIIGLFKRAKRAEHRCEIWEKTVSELQAKIKDQAINS